MALNANTLAALISSQMAAIAESYKNGDKTPEDAHLALATAIVDHIVNNAEVTTSDGATGTIT